MNITRTIKHYLGLAALVLTVICVPKVHAQNNSDQLIININRPAPAPVRQDYILVAGNQFTMYGVILNKGDSKRIVLPTGTNVIIRTLSNETIVLMVQVVKDDKERETHARRFSEINKNFVTSGPTP